MGMTAAEKVDRALMAHGGQHSRYYRYHELSQITSLAGSGALWLTGLSNMETLRKTRETLKCTSIISFADSDTDGTEAWTCLPDTRHVLVTNLLDDESPDTCQQMHTWLRDLVPRIHRCMRSGETILVHCRGGVSRSSTVVLYYMIWCDKQAGCVPATLLEYVQRLKNQRECVAPNLAFLELLDAYIAEE